MFNRYLMAALTAQGRDSLLLVERREKRERKVTNRRNYGQLCSGNPEVKKGDEVVDDDDESSGSFSEILKKEQQHQVLIFKTTALFH